MKEPRTVKSAQNRAYPPEIENSVTVVLEQTTLATLAMLVVMKKYATQRDNMTLLCVFNSFWMTTELYGTEE